MEIILPRPRLIARPRQGLLFWGGVVAAFACGFCAAFAILSRSRAVSVTAPTTDYFVTLPEGRTVITVSDPLADPGQLARFEVEKRGDEVQGIATVEKRIAPREALSPADTAFFRRELRGVFSSSDSGWQRANKIRVWLALLSKRVSMPGLATRVPREAYVRMRRGEPVLCGNLAEIYVALCEAAGVRARVVGMTVLVREGRLGRDAHGAAEIWLPEMGGWVYEDPTFNCFWMVEGHPASALRLHDALMDGREIAVGPPGNKAETASRNYIDPRLYFRHITYEYKAGGDLVYYADPRLEPIDLRDKNWMQTDDRRILERSEAEGNTIVERLSEVAPGVYAQLLGGRLYIRDRRQHARGIRVRSSTSVVRVCDYEHLDAEVLGLFTRAIPSRVVSPGLTYDRGADGSGWMASGPVEVLRSDGWQGMAAAAGGSLKRRFRVSPGKGYLVYAEVNTVRGALRWVAGDAPRGTESSGTVEPGRISEIISDVLQSQSGELEVSFDLPSGGSFRVLNVVVVEAPTFAPAGTSPDSGGLQGRRRMN